MTNDPTITLASTLQAIRARQRVLLHDMDIYIAARKTLRTRLAEHVIVLKTYRAQLIADGTVSQLARKLAERIKKIELLITDIPP